MFDLIRSLIDHTWETGSYTSGDQQYVYYIAGSLIIILTVTFIDLFYRLIRGLLSRGKFD